MVSLHTLTGLAREAASSAHGRAAGAAAMAGAERSEQAAAAHALARLLPALASLDLPCFLHLLGHRQCPGWPAPPTAHSSARLLRVNIAVQAKFIGQCFAVMARSSALVLVSCRMRPYTRVKGSLSSTLC